MRFVVRLFAVACCAVAAFGTAPASAEKRVALAVGIDVYDNLPAQEQLKKAVNDARAMGAGLQELGFDTTVEENLTALAFARAWQKFLNRLEPGDTASLFFSGHGVEIGGVNYLLPRDAPRVGPSEDRVLARASIRFNDLMDDLREKKARVALFIVDACRDNPFRDERGRSVGGTRGLIRVEPARGSFIMYSAGAGEKALDRLGDADNEPTSPYTRTLLPILRTPGLSLQQIATRVRSEVTELARKAQPPHEQTPAYYDQLLGEFVLKPGPAAEAKPPAETMPAVVASRQVPSDVAQAWAVAKDSTNMAVLEAFRHQYGAANAFYDRLAEARLDELKRQQLALLQAEEDRKRAEVDLTRPGRVFRDCDVCPDMVVVPAGSFTMGSPPGEWGNSASEGPQHRVTLARPFAVGKFEVTFDEWDACVRERGCMNNPSDNGWGRGRRPVINVSWNDITQQYLPWLSRKSGKTYRLLTEAEWEYSARGVTSASAPSRTYWWGDSASHEYANYGKEQCCDGLQQGRDQWINTAPVGQFLANPFGLHDLHGNVWEWVQDCWNEHYSGAPADGSAWTAGDCGRRPLRGGAWINAARHLRSAYRYGFAPDFKDNGIGFRVGRTLQGL